MYTLCLPFIYVYPVPTLHIPCADTLCTLLYNLSTLLLPVFQGVMLHKAFAVFYATTSHLSLPSVDRCMAGGWDLIHNEAKEACSEGIYDPCSLFKGKTQAEVRCPVPLAVACLVFRFSPCPHSGRRGMAIRIPVA